MSLANLPAHWEGGVRARFQNASAKNSVSPSEGATEFPPRKFSAQGETRTPTGLPPMVFETILYTISAPGHQFLYFITLA